LAITFLATGWLSLNWLRDWRKARLEEVSSPSIPASLVLCLILFILLTPLSALKILDHSIPRGTILDAKVPVRSAPLENAVVLFELHPGFEVIIREIQQDWVQVTYPGGMTGWIAKNHVMPVSSHF
jgi:hypothetical protein